MRALDAVLAKIEQRLEQQLEPPPIGHGARYLHEPALDRYQYG
jgi:hypothetical protein